jgi:plastocyanin
MMPRTMKHNGTTLLRGLCLGFAALAALPALPATLSLSVSNAQGDPAADTVVLVQPTATWAAQPLPATATVTQRDVRFVPYVTVVPVGGTLRFVNGDSFDHHIRSLPGGPLGSVAPAKQFEFRLGAAGMGRDSSPDVRFDIPGSVLVGCHLHGSMRGHVFVSATPWFAVSDDKGQVTIEGVPEGQVNVRLWHPDQFVEQPPMSLQLGARTQAQARLNFNPRKRPGPRYPASTGYQ